MLQCCSMMVLYGVGHKSTARAWLLDGKKDIGGGSKNMNEVRIYLR